MTKAIQCRYPSTKPTSTGTKGLDHSQDIPTRWPERLVAAPSPGANPSAHDQEVRPAAATGDGDATFDGSLAADLGVEFLDWNVEPDLDFADFLNPQTTSDETVQSPLAASKSPSYSLLHHATSPGPSPPVRGQKLQQQQPDVIPAPSLPAEIPFYTLRSMVHRPIVTTGPRRIANLILHTLKSYPLMIMGSHGNKQNSLPPFIHPLLASADLRADVLEINDHMEPLHNCMSLVHMLGHGFRGSRKLFWKNVRMECERLCAEVRLELT